MHRQHSVIQTTTIRPQPRRASWKKALHCTAQRPPPPLPMCACSGSLGYALSSGTLYLSAPCSCLFASFFSFSPRLPPTSSTKANDHNRRVCLVLSLKLEAPAFLHFIGSLLHQTLHPRHRGSHHTIPFQVRSLSLLPRLSVLVQSLYWRGLVQQLGFFTNHEYGYYGGLYRLSQDVHDPVQSRDLFRRVGQYVRHLQIRERGSNDLEAFVDIVRDSCWALQNLAVHHNCLTHKLFERLVLGIGAKDDDRQTGPGENEPLASAFAVPGRAQTKQTIARTLRSPTNAFLSDSLRLLVLSVHPASCESILHWIGLAVRKYDRLQNLEQFKLQSSYGYGRCSLLDYVEVPIHLSLLLLFLRSWNGRKGATKLREVSINFGDVFDDMEEEPIEDDDEDDFVYVSRYWSRPSNLPPKRGAAQESRRQTKGRRQGPACGAIPRNSSGITTLPLLQVRSRITLSKLLQRLPCLKTLSFGYLDDPTFLKSIRTYAPQLVTLKCKKLCSFFQDQDWIDYFDVKPQKHSQKDVSVVRKHWEIDLHRNHRLQGLHFGFHAQTSITDRVLLQIARPLQASRFHTLSLSGADGVSGMGVLALLQNCSGLQVLNVMYGRLNGSMFQQSLDPWACYKTLRELTLSFVHFDEQDLNNEQSTRGFRQHLYRLEKLEKLSLDGQGLRKDLLLLSLEEETEEWTEMPPQLLHVKSLYCPGVENSLTDRDYAWLGYLFPNNTWTRYNFEYEC